METWTTRELPVLRALVDKFDDIETGSVRIETLPAATGLAEIDVHRALRSLDTADPPYMSGTRISELPYPIIISNVTERARRAVGQWPASDLAADAIVAALNDAAEQESDEEKRSSLRNTAAFLGGAGKEVLYRVITQVSGQEITQHIPRHF
jgi:hypothetical protein